MTAFALHSHCIVTYPFYFIFRTFFLTSLLLLLIFPMFVFGSNSKGFRQFKSGISFSLKSLKFSFSIFFLSFSVLFHFVAAHKKDSFELTVDLNVSLNYVHVSK